MYEPSRGEVWLVDLNPVRGHEQTGRRPSLVISVDGFNYGPAGLVVIIPITTKAKGIPFHVIVSLCSVIEHLGITKDFFAKVGAQESRRVQVYLPTEDLGQLPFHLEETQAHRFSLLEFN